MIRPRETALGAWLPTAAAWVRESRAHAALRGTLARSLGRELRAELYIAFDDPYTPLALDAVGSALAASAMPWTVRPVVRRGIPGDRYADARRRYAVLDASRVAARRQAPLLRVSPIEAERCADLASWVEGARLLGKDKVLAVALADRLWRHGTGWPDYGELYATYKKIVGAVPRTTLRHRQRVRRNEDRLSRRGHWDTPVVWLEGKWFSAVDRTSHLADYASELVG